MIHAYSRCSCAIADTYVILTFMKENETLKRRVLDLANRCYQQNIYTFSGFLNAAEVSDVYLMERELDFVPWKLFGGTEGCETADAAVWIRRKTLGYVGGVSHQLCGDPPSAPKFAEDLSHRDFLGALMNLGIEGMFLVILLSGILSVMCSVRMPWQFIWRTYYPGAPYRHDHRGDKRMSRAGGTAVSGEEFVVSSNRCDAIIAKAYKLSRTRSTELFHAGKIFVNGRQYDRNSGILKSGDIVSVRGFGKFCVSWIFTGDQKRKDPCWHCEICVGIAGVQSTEPIVVIRIWVF